MPKFRSRPVEIEAIQFNGYLSLEDINWLQDHSSNLYRANIVDRPEGQLDSLSITMPNGEGRAEVKVAINDWVIYNQNGELYPCPDSTFKAKYTELTETGAGGDPKPERGLSFADALEALEAGSLVARHDWRDRGAFLYLVPGSKFSVNRPPLNQIFDEGTLINYHGHIDMRTASGYCVPWSASQSDLLAKDWTIVTDVV